VSGLFFLFYWGIFKLFYFCYTDIMKKIIFIIFVLAFAAGVFNFALAQEEPQVDISFFYGETCPHCSAEQKFLDAMEKKYPNLEIKRYSLNEPKAIELLKDLCKKCESEKYLGLVPLTFIGDNFFLGFDNENGMGRQIEDYIQRHMESAEKPEEDKEKIQLPIIGEIDVGEYSLPILAVVLGTLDGFNVCSLGALVLILGLVLTIRSRKKIILFGGLFILTTAVVYGILIFLWHQLFSLLAPYIRLMEILIGFLGLGGGIYFLKQFIKYQKHGPACEAGFGQKIASKFSQKLQKFFGTRDIFAIISLVFLFAVIITIVEFPCSAVIPVIFAGIVAKADLAFLNYLLIISLFVLFYMLDELIVFLIAAYKMTLWISSGKFIVWITLIEAIALFLLGFYYLL